MVTPDTLRDVSLFFGLSDAALAEVSRRAIPRRFGTGAVLWRVGDPSRGLVVLLEGEVRLLRGGGGGAAGRQHVIHREGPGATLGEVPLFAGGGYPAMARAAGAVRCLLLSRADLEAVIRVDPRLAWRLLERLARRVRDLVGRMDGRLGRTVAQRLGGYLLDRADQLGSDFDLGQSQANLAEELGTVREVVVRELGRLCADGTLGRSGRGRFRVRDRVRLERLARGE